MKHCVTIAVTCLLLAGCGRQDEETQPFTITRGEMGATKYCIAAPRADWNGQVVLLTHGLRPEHMPTTAEFAVNSPFYQRLGTDGWIIGSTSYRRYGMTVKDTAQDIHILRQHIERTYGKARRVFVIGRSTGGAAAVLIAETDKANYHGVLAVGATLSSTDAPDPYELTYQPVIPILFLSNQNALAGPKRYLARADGAEEIPILWRVRRDGQCNISDAEQAAAFDALFKYAATGLVVPDHDATVPLNRRTSTAKIQDGGAYTKVTEVSKDFGNLYTALVEADLISLGIERESDFSVSFKGRAFRGYYGTTYSDVPRGAWVGFLAWDGKFRIARNFENASETLGCEQGDTVFIQR